MSKLFLIPAKGGSTRFKKKNIADLFGKPLLAYPIENALKSGLSEKIIVSTEDEEIANVARRYGAEVPFIRPMELARDPATVSDVCLHTLEKVDPDGKKYETLIILLPTAPLTTHEDIVKAYNVFTENKGKFLISITECESPPYNALQFKCDDKSMVSCFPTSEFRHTKSTECPKSFQSNGAIAVVDIASFKKNGSLWGDRILGYEMPRKRSIDIDTKLDLELEKFFMGQKQKDSN